VEEMKKRIIIAFLIAISMNFAIGYGYFPVKGQQMHAKESAYAYLVNSYNSTLGLCYEYPGSHTYWLSHDNVLASYVLQNWNREIADNISKTVEKLAVLYGLERHPSGILKDGRVDILLGYSYDALKDVNTTFEKDYLGSKIKTETVENTNAQGIQGYADLLCYASLMEWRKQNYSGADYYYEKVKAMWDGNGFRDIVFNKTGYYATYKLGLFYFLNKMTRNGSFVFESQLIERVWQCQDFNGGFKTDYYGNGSFPVCQTNTETTAIILLSGIPYSLAYEKNVKVGAYYYIWWGIPFNDHWKGAIKGTPFLGKYNSNNSTIADQHILLAKQHGIDFFAVSWFGKGEWLNWDYDDIDQNLRSGLLNASHLSNFQFCLFYESECVLNDALNVTLNPDQNFTRIFIEDMTYAAEEYFPNPSYLRIDGKPVIFIYNLPYIYNKLGTIEAQNLLSILRQRLDLYLVGDLGSNCISPHEVNSSMLYSMNAITNYFFANAKASEGWSNITEYARTYYPEWREAMNSTGIKFIPNAYPGFNNTGLAGVVNPTELPNNATMFKEMLKIAINDADSDLKIVMITSWNEWLESTAIEPSMEFGELFLHAIYDIVVPEFPSSTFFSVLMILTMFVAVCSKKKFAKIKNKRYK
jgi:hypothetical protein